MDRLRNPFAPGAGTPPPELVGRSDILDNARIALARIRSGRHEKSFLLVGLRGVGKTVLLNRIQDIADQESFKTIFIEAPENKRLPALLIPPLRQALLALDRFEHLSEQVKRALRVLKAFAGAIKIETQGIE